MALIEAQDLLFFYCCFYPVKWCVCFMFVRVHQIAISIYICDFFPLPKFLPYNVLIKCDYKLVLAGLTVSVVSPKTLHCINTTL